MMNVVKAGMSQNAAILRHISARTSALAGRKQALRSWSFWRIFSPHFGSNTFLGRRVDWKREFLKTSSHLASRVGTFERWQWVSGLIWTDLTKLWYQANWVSSFRSPHANQTPSNIDFDTEPASLLKKPQIFPAFSCSPGPSQKQQKICWHFSPGNKFKWINISAGTLGWPNRIRKMTLFLWDCPGTEERSLQICDILSCTRHWPEAEGSTDQSEASIILADQLESNTNWPIRGQYYSNWPIRGRAIPLITPTQGFHCGDAQSKFWCRSILI